MGQILRGCAKTTHAVRAAIREILWVAIRGPSPLWGLGYGDTDCQAQRCRSLARLADVLARIASTPFSRLPEFLPWEWKKLNQPAAASQPEYPNDLQILTPRCSPYAYPAGTECSVSLARSQVQMRCCQTPSGMAPLAPPKTAPLGFHPETFPTGSAAVVLLRKTTATFRTQTIAVATDGDDAAVVQQPVQNGCGDDGVAKHRAPLTNVAIGGDEHGTLLVAAASQLEEEMGRVGFERQVTELVD
jgi:hypothetical protein